tara:strand:+ start:251 stop:592 length:342 start_codon:yes stop_codon:yes gene_type:complete
MRSIRIKPAHAGEVHIGLNSKQRMEMPLGTFQLTLEEDDAPVKDRELTPEKTVWTKRTFGQSLQESQNISSRMKWVIKIRRKSGILSRVCFRGGFLEVGKEGGGAGVSRCLVL